MTIKVADFAKLTDDLQSIFNEIKKIQQTQEVRKVFGTENMDRRTHEHLVINPQASISEVGDGEEYPESDLTEWDSIIYTARKYGWIVKITEEMREDDLYNQIESVAKSQFGTLYRYIYQDMADLLLNGFATSYTNPYGKVVSSVWPDGLALFSASHTAWGVPWYTYSNIITAPVGTGGASVTNPALSYEAVEFAINDMLTYVAPDETVAPITAKKLVVSPKLKGLAERILYSTLAQGTANNDKNTISSIELVVVPQLGQSDYWFLLGENYEETLKLMFRVAPTMVAPDQVYNTWDWKYKVRTRYTLGIGYQAYVRGSKGTNAA